MKLTMNEIVKLTQGLIKIAGKDCREEVIEGIINDLMVNPVFFSKIKEIGVEQFLELDKEIIKEIIEGKETTLRKSEIVEGKIFKAITIIFEDEEEKTLKNLLEEINKRFEKEDIEIKKMKNSMNPMADAFKILIDKKVKGEDVKYGLAISTILPIKA